MLVRKYEPRDFAQISAWASDGYDTEYSEDLFPKTGFIVDGVAAFFLYATDSKVCFLENMISNREVQREIKEVALDLILEAIFKEAREQGFRVAHATSNNPKIIIRALKHRCKVEPKNTLITKNLIDLS